MGVSAVKVSSSAADRGRGVRVGAEKFLGFDVAGTSGPARADCRELACVFVGGCAVEVLLG